MWKPTLAASAVIAIAGTSLVHAAEPAPKPSQDKNQDKTWPAFERAAREGTRLRLEQLTSHTNSAAPGRFLDPAEWMARRAAALEQSGGALKKLGDAVHGEQSR